MYNSDEFSGLNSFQNLKKQKTGKLRTILFLVSIITIVALLVTLFFTFMNIKNLQGKLASEKKEKEQIAQEKGDLADENNRIKGENKDLKSQIDEMGSKISEYQERIATLEIEKQQAVDEAEKSRLEAERLAILAGMTKDNFKAIALTYDDGPSSTTAELLDVMKEKNVKATFFVLGSQVEKYPETSKRIVDEGHEIANHSYIHQYLTELDEQGKHDEMVGAQNAISSISGGKPRLMRPPGGHYDDNVKAFCKKNDWRIIMWSVDTRDWDHRDPKKLVENAFIEGREGVRNGAVVLMHDIYQSTVDGSKILFDKLNEQKFITLTVSQLLALRADGGIAGEVYDVLLPSEA